MAFSIHFVDPSSYEPIEEDGTSFALGEVVLGDFVESFHSSLYRWTTTQYEEQWLESVRSILGGAAKAALITEYFEATEASHLVWWPLYRVADVVYIQNHLLFFDQLDRSFDAKNSVASLKDRRTHGEGGVALSEWQVHIDDLDHYDRGFERG